jgi:hypothetical protein
MGRLALICVVVGASLWVGHFFVTEVLGASELASAIGTAFGAAVAIVGIASAARTLLEPRNPEASVHVVIRAWTMLSGVCVMLGAFMVIAWASNLPPDDPSKYVALSVAIAVAAWVTWRVYSTTEVKVDEPD